MTRFLSFIAAMLMAVPGLAAELDDRYESMGTMTVTLDGTATRMVIPYDREKDRPYAEQKMIMGSFLTINTVGRVVDETGKPGRPMVQVTLQKRNGDMALISAEIFDDKGYDAPMVMGADGGDGKLVAFEMTPDNVVTATVEGTFLRLTGYTSEPRVADGAEPVAATIEWTAEIAPLE
ncbi:hypothetical protein KZZ07_02965 [Mameliella sp. CS4]|uniref:hypothetical protein n=1 Tax=Mameliella sp. CS4 TaxID=2862329 RepID=UPI001C5E2410|nr:hypothetical protein [Mameliella sp. CS4]MBW4981493.1 hypothetical protein [Mameliella sp. CS4]